MHARSIFSIWIAAGLLALLAAPDAAAQKGSLTQLEDTAGCVSETGTSGDCTDGKGLDSAAGVAVSKDGKHVYVASPNSDAVAIFVRNKKTGALTQLESTAGCISETGTSGDCTDGKGLDGANGVAVSKDGKHVYVASAASDAVAIFARQKKK
jgi:DNA-binding beta-propeller fold protein YncE